MTPSFDLYSPPNPPQLSYGFAVGDFNGDGAPNIAFVFDNSTIGILLAISAKNTTTTLTASPDPSTLGQSVTLTATVSPSTATGTITFSDGTTELGASDLSAGTAKLVVSSFTTGDHSLTAAYGGDAKDLPSTSASIPEAVNPLPTSTTLTSAPNPSAFNQAVTFKAAVSPAAATGTVTFSHGSTALGKGTLTGGKATLSFSALPVGTHAITATYSGDENHATSTSKTLTQTVGKATTSTALNASPNPSTFGQNVVLTANVAPVTATGPVTFYAGTTALGTGTLNEGTARLALSTLPAGGHSITASYGGDANDGASTSAPVTQILRDATSTILASSPNPSTLNQSVTFTATVLPATATGTVTFFHGSTSLGVSPVNHGQATLGVSTLPDGSHAITAVYNGNSIDGPSTSTILTQVVN